MLNDVIMCNNIFFIFCQLKTREREALQYSESLKEKFGEFPQVKRIARHRHVPKHVYQAKKELRIIKDSKARKYVIFPLTVFVTISSFVYAMFT